MLHKCQKIITKNEHGENGWVVPFAKTSDKFWENYDIKYVYASSISPNCKKGPILHLKRECRLFPVCGRCRLIVKRNGIYEKIILDSAVPYVAAIEVGSPFCLYNDDKDECVVINVANHCWTESDQDTNKVEDWVYDG